MSTILLPTCTSDTLVAPPNAAYPGDAGVDLKSNATITLQPFERALVPTGLSFAIPTGCAGFVLPRSGLSSKHGITLVNTPGLIDSNYRGEVHVAAINLDPSTPYTINQGDRIAQLVVMDVHNVEFLMQDSLDETPRGTQGFGSSGTN